MRRLGDSADRRTSDSRRLTLVEGVVEALAMARAAAERARRVEAWRSKVEDRREDLEANAHPGLRTTPKEKRDGLIIIVGQDSSFRLQNAGTQVDPAPASSPQPLRPGSSM